LILSQRDEACFDKGIYKFIYVSTLAKEDSEVRSTKSIISVYLYLFTLIKNVEKLTEIVQTP